MEYWITAKPSTLGKPMSNSVLERIHQVLKNLVQTFNRYTQTYVDKIDQWTVTLSAAAFGIFSTNNEGKCYSPG